MKYVLEACLVALALTTMTASRVAAQTPNSAADAAQPMHKGISVELPVASNAHPMPDADQEDALIVSITEDGGVYLGVDPINPAALAERVEAGLTNQPEKKVYIKADARAPYGDVVKVLDAVRTADVGAANLLTAHQNRRPRGRECPQRACKYSWAHRRLAQATRRLGCGESRRDTTCHAPLRPLFPSGLIHPSQRLATNLLLRPSLIDGEPVPS
jgi:biopolymer transport protein ExbD